MKLRHSQATSLGNHMDSESLPSLSLGVRQRLRTAEGNFLSPAGHGRWGMHQGCKSRCKTKGIRAECRFSHLHVADLH